MSYNVDTWKTKEIIDLKIPVESFYKSERKDWHPTRTNNDDGTVTFSVMMDESEIQGSIENGIVNVASISVTGEGSGSALHYVYEPALKDSTGTLIVTRVWEAATP